MKSKKSEKVLAIICAFGLGILGVAFGAQKLIHSRQLATRGKTVTGEVLDLQDHVSGRFRWHTYYARVLFQPKNGESVRQQVEVSKAVFLAAQTNSEVNVFYLAEDPTICAVGDKVALRYGYLLMGIGLLCVGGYLLVFFKAPADKDEALDELEGRLKTMTQTRHDYAPVDACRFTHLDLGFYDGTQRQLEAQGYRLLGDEENLSLRRGGNPRTFIRTMLSGDQIVMADMFHFKPGWMLRVLSAKETKVIDFETWFSDGCFVCTNNAEMAGKLQSAPGIESLYMPAGTACQTLLEAHRRRVSNYLANHRGVEAVRLQGREDVRRAQDAQQRIKAEFRKKVGLTKTELENIAGSQSKEVDELHAMLNERHERAGAAK